MEFNTKLALSINNLNQIGDTLNQVERIIVPNSKALAKLGDISSAFSGAIFISFTAGTTISLLSLLLIIFCIKLSKDSLCKSHFLFFSITTITTTLIIILGAGFYTVVYIFFIPFTLIFIFTLLSNKKAICSDYPKEAKNKAIFILMISLLITGIFYFLISDRSIFLRVRDYLLLSNKAGVILNDFYYRYTLYAAQAIMLPSYNLMKFFCLCGLIIALPATIYSTSYLLIFYFIKFLIYRLLKDSFISFIIDKDRTSIVLGTVAGFVNILIFLFILYNLYPLSFSKTPQQLSIKTMLEHSDFKIRIEGLRELCIKNNENNINILIKKELNENREESIWNYPNLIQNVMKKNTVEKYWLANSLGGANKVDAIIYLEELINDKSINVQCAAIEAITKLSVDNSGLYSNANKKEGYYFQDKAVRILKNKIANSDEWYVQNKAYNCLKKLGKI